MRARGPLESRTRPLVVTERRFRSAAQGVGQGAGGAFEGPFGQLGGFLARVSGRRTTLWRPIGARDQRGCGSTGRSDQRIGDDLPPIGLLSRLFIRVSLRKTLGIFTPNSFFGILFFVAIGASSRHIEPAKEPQAQGRKSVAPVDLTAEQSSGSFRTAGR